MDWLEQRPRLVVGSLDSAYAAHCSRYFRRHGWEVHLATSGEEVHRLIGLHTPQVIVLDIHLPDESGWLVCAKNMLVDPERRIILVGGRPMKDEKALAEFVGASKLVWRADALDALAQEVQGSLVAAV